MSAHTPVLNTIDLQKQTKGCDTHSGFELATGD